MKQSTSLLALLFLLPLSLLAQKGTISGKLIDKSTGEDLIGASIKAESPAGNTGAVTDIEGKFLISAEPSTYILTFSYSSYKTEQLEVTVKPGEVSYVNLSMEESANALTEVVITYTIEKASSLAQLTERKNAAQVSDGISADVIRRTPDRTTSDVLKRVTGASIQEGKFAVIRGMNDRYNAGYLDGALLPSTESDRKAFAFDVVPANLIDNLMIIKAGSPDLVGDFGGGIIKINTKSVPEQFTQHLSIGGQTHSLTTFKGFTQFKRYSGESLNIVSPERDLPAFADNALRPASTFPSAEEKREFANISRQFNNDWSNEVIDALPNTRLAYSMGFPVRLSDTKKLGVIMALNYANTRRYSEGKVNSYDGSGQVAAFNDNAYLQNISSGGIFNINYVASKTQISLRNLLNINTDNNTIVRSGSGNLQDAVMVQNMANVINYNRLYNSIASVKQIVGSNLFTVNASVNYSNVRRRIPDYRIVNYTITPDFESYRLALGDFFNTSTGRFASDLNEGLFGGNFELSKQLDGRFVKTDLKAGAFYQKRDRSFESRSFVYGGNQSSELSYNPATDLGIDNIDPGRLYLVEKTSNDIAYYNGAATINAFYAAADQKFFEKLRAVYGVRYEDADIHVFNEKVGSEVARIQEGVVLPSANISYSLSEKMNLRAAYYASVNRPEFRELAPFAFYVFDKNAEIRGNTNLKIARLNNYDLRLEFFPSGSQVISVGGFYKNINNPVEFGIDVAQPFTTFTYQNEKSARVYGIELEVRKNFDFLGDAKFLSDLSVFSNLAFIKSELTFAEGSLAKQNRPLQGQSPYVLNAGLQFEDQESGWFGSVVVNRVGRRIAFVGVAPEYGDTRQDIYEEPRTVLDFQVGKNIKRFNLKFTVGDLLKQNLTYYQDADGNGKYSGNGAGGDRLMFQFANGFTTSLTAGYTF
jgi:outer membrane receptor protein involved in Fe transport